MKFSKVSDGHFWTESRSVTLGTHDLYMNEYGAWECDCPRYVFRKQCAHSDELTMQLCTNVISPARLAVQRSRANGENLVSIFDYSSAPTHKPTNRNHVQQFPSGAISFASARPTHGRVSAGELPVICERCSHENAPGTLYCEVCRQYVAEASLSYSA